MHHRHGHRGGALATLAAVVLGCSGTSVTPGDTGASDVGAELVADAAVVDVGSEVRDVPVPPADGGFTGTEGPGEILTPDSVWYRPVAGLDPTPGTQGIIDFLDANAPGFQIDVGHEGAVYYGIPFYHVRSSRDPLVHLVWDQDTFYDGECDTDPVPIPAAGFIEGGAAADWSCDTAAGDCHALFIDDDTRVLHELYNVRRDAMGVWHGGCQARWDLRRTYDGSNRGEHCTSADAAGLQILPGLIGVRETSEGAIRHALRFILPGRTIRGDVYVHPASHTASYSGPATAPPMGVRLRLHRNFTLPGTASRGARAIVLALQTYGMILADAGTITWVAQPDRDTAQHWEGLLGSRDLRDVLHYRDFDVVEMGATIPRSGDCHLTR